VILRNNICYLSDAFREIILKSNNLYIEPSIIQLIDSFKEYWSRYKGAHPSYELDDSWMSLGVVDLITFPFRFVFPTKTEDLNKFRSSVAYSALVLSEFWIQYGLEVKIISNDENGIQVIAKRGDNSVTFLIEDELTSFFQMFSEGIPATFQVFKDFSRSFSADSSMFHSFLYGPAIGYSDNCSFPWNEDTDVFESAIEVFQKSLARQNAEWFSRVVPNNPLLQVPEFYLKRLVFPPYLCDKNPPLVSVADTASAYLKSLGLNPAQLKGIGRDLCFAPDEILSSFGALLYLSMCEVGDQIDPVILACARPKANHFAIQRLAIQGIAYHFGRSWDWLKGQCRDERSMFVYEQEKYFGMLPWLTLEGSSVSSYFSEAWFEEFIGYCMDYNLTRAIQVLDSKLEKDPGDIELCIQRIKLSMIARDLQDAHERCKRLLSEPEADSNPQFFNLWGYILLDLGEPDGASRYFKAGLAVCPEGGNLRSEMLNNLAWSYLGIGKIREAEDLLDESISISKCPVTALLNKGAIAWEERRIEDLYAIREKAIKLAPHDRRVFASVGLLPAFTQS